MKTSRKNRLYRQLLAATLLIGGTFNLAAPVLAAGTPAGTSISNTATGSYEDSNNPGVPINATSNTVTIQVAEVAGISLTTTNDKPTDVNGGTLQPNDILNYDFTVTNTGNDATKFFIPDTATVTGSGTRQKVQYSMDGTNFTDVGAGGFTTASVAVNGKVYVRVVVKADATASAGSSIAVTLGKTNPANAQNVAVDPNDQSSDVRTVDNTTAVPGEADPTKPPANGERKSSATLSTTVSEQSQVQNGPSGAPAAVGPKSTNDDFTNASTAVPAGLDPATKFDPGAKSFTNTVKNASTTDSEIVSLLPTPLADPTQLPDGTLVTLSYEGKVAVYKYTQSTNSFAFQTTGSTNTAANDPIEITLAAGESKNYQVSIDLPANTDQLKGYTVPVTAFIDFNDDGLIGFIDKDGDNLYDPGEETNPANTTINRAYTGFVRLAKETRILKGDGPDVISGQGTFSTAQKNPAPGNIIEYQITYTNVSDAAPTGGSGNKIMNASKVVITEDGTAGTNSWAKDTNNDGVIDTSNVVGTAKDAKGTVAFSPSDQTGTTAATDVTKYVDTVTADVAPGTNGTFVIQRKVN